MVALADGYLDFVADRRVRWSAVLSFNRRQADTPPQWYLAKEIALFAIIERAIRGAPALKTKEETHNAARALWASVHGIVVLSLNRGDPNKARKEAHDQITFVLKAMDAALEKAPD